MSAPTPQPPIPPVDRRAFFRKLLLRGLDEVENRSRELGQRFSRAMAANSGSVPAPSPRPAARPVPDGAQAFRGSVPADAVPCVPPPQTAPRHLRPPGALAEPQFAATCEGCGDCVAACPAQCIRLDQNQANGLPYIVARQSPCVICDDLSCMKVCPTGALRLVESVTQIAMGRAVVNHDSCLRHPLHGEQDCRLCIEPCPLGVATIGAGPDGRIDIRSGCVGCGLCEHACPTEPTSIWVAGRL